MEALRAGRPVDRLLVTASSLQHVDRQARAAGIPVIVTTSANLDRLARTGNHQGVIAIAGGIEPVSLDEVITDSDSAMVIVLDGVQDPHNLGAVIRVADGSGADGVVIPRRRAAGLGPGTLRAAAGAAEHVPVARVGNLVSAIRRLQQSGYWVVGAEADGDTLVYEADLTGRLAIVVGGEARGLARLTREACDYTVRIPLRGRVNSLNASVATAVIAFEALRQRLDAGHS